MSQLIQTQGGAVEYRRIRVPQHRLTPLRAQWENIVSPIVEYLKLQIRFNTKGRSVELKTSELTEDAGTRTCFNLIKKLYPGPVTIEPEPVRT